MRLILITASILIGMCSCTFNYTKLDGQGNTITQNMDRKEDKAVSLSPSTAVSQSGATANGNGSANK